MAIDASLSLKGIGLLSIVIGKYLVVFFNCYESKVWKLKCVIECTCQNSFVIIQRRF